MSLSESVLDAIGNTPLVRLKRVTLGLKPKIYAKLEFMNPGGSVKDRIAAYLVADAERRHLLKKGGTIIEPTSGNTGIGLAMLAAVRGYKAVFTMPDKVSEEKRALLRAYGAKVVIAPTDLAPELAGALRQRGEEAREGDPRLLHAEPVPEQGQPEGALRHDRPGDMAPDERQSGRARRWCRHGGDHLGRREVPEDEEEVPARCRRGA